MTPHISSESEALVLGGSSGIGLATAEQLSSRGIDVHLVGRTEAKLADAVENLPGDGTGEYSVVDLSEDPDVDAFVEAVEATEASIQYLANAAGTFEPKAFLDHTKADYDKYNDLTSSSA